MTTPMEPPDYAPSESGSRVGKHPLPPRYELLRFLGRGGQKHVDLARDHLLERDVAIARVERELVSDSDLATLRALQNDGSLGLHANIVPCDALIETDDELLLISPYLSGGTLESLLTSRPDRRLSTSQSINLAQNISRALAHAHRRGVIHGDVKPENILLDSEEHAFLTDFGLARFDSSASADLRGTPAYLAPEVIQGEAPSQASDLYALGCVLYEMLAGELLYRSRSMADLFRLHQSGRPPGLAALRETLPPQLFLLIERLLEKDPDRRPSFALDITGALWGMSRARAAFGKSALDTDDSPDLIGRNLELGRIEEVSEAALQGDPHLLLLSGQGGVGKTRLLREVLARAARRDVIVLYGMASEDWPLPYGPFVDALIQLAPQLTYLETQTAAQFREFLYLTLEGGVDFDTDKPLIPTKTLYELIVSGLKKVCPRCPVMIVIEDLHHADSASLDLLRHFDLAFGSHSESEPFPLAILGSFSRLEASDELLDLAASIATHSHGEHIKLKAFGEPGTHAFLEAVGLRRPSRSLIEEAHRYSDGNPLVLKELIHDLRERGALEERNGQTTNTLPIGELAPTTSVAEWISGKIDSFDAREAMILSGCALIGFEIDQKIFREQVERQGTDPDDLIRRAVEARLFKETHGQLDFFHPLIRKALAKRLTPDQCQRVHLAIAEQWDGAEHHDPRLRDLEAARHLIAAGSHAEPARVSRYAKRAAQHALARSAWTEAAFFLEAALEHADDPIEQAELHDRAARAHFRRLDAEPCLRHFDRATQILRHTGDRNRFLRVLSGYLRARVWLGEPWPDGSLFDTEDLRRGLDSLENDERALRVLVLTALSEYEFFLGNVQQANEFRLTAASSGEPVEDPHATAALSMSLGSTAHHALRIREGLAIWQRGFEEARSAGDSLVMASCLQRIQMASFSAGDFAAIESVEHSVREISQTSELLGRPALMSSLRAALALQRGDFDACERHVREATALLGQKRYPWLVMVIAPAMANIRALAGDLAGAQQALDLMSDPAICFRESLQRDELARTCRALCNCYVGEPAGLSPEEDARLRTALEQPEHDSRSLFAACLATELAGPTQDTRLAALALPVLQTAESLGWVFTQTWPLFIPRLLGVAATLVNDFELADRSFERALSCSDRLDLPIERGRTLLDCAQMLALRNGAGDLERAASLATAASQDLSLCPKSSFAARAEKLDAYLRTRI